MENTQKTINDLKKDIENAAHLEMKFRRFANNKATPEQIAKTEQVLIGLGRIIARREAQIRKLENKQAEYVSQKPVTFYGIEYVNNRVSSAVGN